MSTQKDGVLVIDPTQLRNHEGNPVKFYGGQELLIRSLVPRVIVFGGFGAGKTLPFALKAVVSGAAHGPGYYGLLLSPTHEMFTRTLLPTIRDDLLSQLGDPDNGRSLWDLCQYYPSNKSLTLWNGFIIYFGSADKPIRSRGTNLAFVGIDEASMIRNFKELYISVTSRLRRGALHPVTGRSMNQLFCNTTPEGMDEVHDTFCEPPALKSQRAKWSKTHQVIRISMLENPGLPQSFIDQQFMDIPASMRESYIEGQHQHHGSGLCYHEFRFDSNVREQAKYDPSKDLHISFDFNKDPMSLTIHQIMGTDKSMRSGRGLLMTVSEIVMRNSNTPEVCREFVRQYGREGHNHKRAIYIYGDASDAVGISNYDEIESWLRSHFHGKIVLRVPTSNPRHNRRLKSCNALLRNIRGEVRWWINPTCVWTIRDLKRQIMTDDGRSKRKDQDSGDGTKLGHCSDTCDYIIDYICPFRRIIAREAAMGKSPLTSFIDQ